MVLAEIPRVSVDVLTNSRGLPWTTDGFKSSWGDELKRKPLKELHDKELVFHGLRKSAVVFLLEAGCTDAEVSAITGQSRQMAEHYARQVNPKKAGGGGLFEVAGCGRVATNEERKLAGFVKHRMRNCKTAKMFHFVLVLSH